MFSTQEVLQITKEAEEASIAKKGRKRLAILRATALLWQNRDRVECGGMEVCGSLTEVAR